MKNKHDNFSLAREIAYTAVMCALLIGAQFAFSFVAGVEIVTLILACYSSVFGIRRGGILAVCFSLLRCLLFGFYPTVLVLYIIYYPLFAVIFGLLGHIKKSTYEKYPIYFYIIINIVLIGIATSCALLYMLNIIKVSRLLKTTINVMLLTIFGLGSALCLAFNGLFLAGKVRNKNTAPALKVLLYTAVAAVCTVCFTLLDDVITPLMYGYTFETALAYFYTSFTAMLPQTLCAIASVSALYLPLELLFNKVKRG